MPAYKMQATATFVRGMRDAQKLPGKGIPEYEVIAEVLERGLGLPPSRNLEKLYDRSQGPVYSVRIDEGRRMTFQVLPKNLILFRAVGKHDDVYRKDEGMS